MVRVLIGDLFESRAQTLVNAVNCVGVMGKGIAEQFKGRFPAMFEDYKRRSKRKQVRLGEPYLYRDSSGVQIVNFPTKGHWRSASRLADVEHGLDYLAKHVEKWRIHQPCAAGAWMWRRRIGVVRRRTADLSQAQQASNRCRALRTLRNLEATIGAGVSVGALP